MTKTIDKPILFSTEMIKAILDGRKTVTRWVIKPQPDSFHISGTPKGLSMLIANSPYQVGMKLWVRETWWSINNKIYSSGIIPDLIYKADYPIKENKQKRCGRCNRNLPREKNKVKWRPSIFMPRWASRITLEIIDIRIERLQDISEKDAKAEGVEFSKYDVMRTGKLLYKHSFQQLWDTIQNGKNNGNNLWYMNPYVYVIRFKRI